MGKLEDRIALITGADSGIGAATAVEYAREGADVVVHFHSDEDGANRTKQQVESCGRRAIIVQADVGNEEQVQQMFDAGLNEFGRLDVLVNNAGVDDTGTPVAELKVEDFERTMRTNVTGPLMACKLFINHRKDQGGGGKIINVSSIHEDAARAGGASYDCSKGALRNLMRTLVLEVSDTGMTVNNIAPGMILTEMNQEAIDDEDKRREQEAHIPLGRAGKPEEIGRLAVFLASSDADYITGSTHVMDGGLMRVQAQGA